VPANAATGARRHGPWLIEESSPRYTSPFLELHEDRVKKPDGTPGTYATVTLKRGVAVLPVGDDAVVHLTRQFRYALGRDSIEVVSGALEEGEDPLPAAQRELREELGLTAEQWTDIGMFDLDTSILRCPVRLFVAGTLHATSVDPDPTERISRVSVPFEEAVRMVMNSDITHAPSCVLILKAERARSGGTTGASKR
jgi:8-oxo-dGTP pyrophosphatase MutT (NUDIX family)